LSVEGVVAAAAAVVVVVVVVVVNVSPSLGAEPIKRDLLFLAEQALGPDHVLKGDDQLATAQSGPPG